MKKFMKYFNKFSWVSTLIMGFVTSELYGMFTKEMWFAVLLFAYGTILGVFQEKGRNKNE